MRKNRNRRARIRAKRYYLMQADPHCSFCGREVFYRVLKTHEPMPENFAVVFRLRSRLNPDYGKEAIVGESYSVLACRKCADDRSAAEAAALGIDELHERAKRSGKVG